jgi:hypothetical protein
MAASTRVYPLPFVKLTSPHFLLTTGFPTSISSARNWSSRPALSYPGPGGPFARWSNNHWMQELAVASGMDTGFWRLVGYHVQSGGNWGPSHIK